MEGSEYGRSEAEAFHPDRFRLEIAAAEIPPRSSPSTPINTGVIAIVVKPWRDAPHTSTSIETIAIIAIPPTVVVVGTRSFLMFRVGSFTEYIAEVAPRKGRYSREINTFPTGR